MHWRAGTVHTSVLPLVLGLLWYELAYSGIAAQAYKLTDT
jgi:hypothetical protein